MNKPKTILSTGNEAVAEAAVRAGCDLYAGYPITPQNELTAYMSRRMNEEGRVFIQAESELAAINMVFGASVAGKRGMTSSSSPGISLKQEGISYMAAAELPGVIVNVMRGGPGLGNIGPSQSDYFQATRSGGHGDYHCIVLAPCTAQECADLTCKAFDLADRYRTPAIILMDGMLGQLMEPVVLPEWNTKNPAAAKDWALTGAKGRPGHSIRSLLLPEGSLERHNRKLQAKYLRIKREIPSYEGLYLDDAMLVMVAYGTTSRIARNAIEALRKQGVKAGLIRPITLWPFPENAFKQLKKNAVLLALEMSCGQMVEDVRLFSGTRRVEFYGRCGGGIPTEAEIVRKARSVLNKKKR